MMNNKAEAEVDTDEPYVPNKAVRAAFEKFLKAVAQESPEAVIFSPLLNTEGLFDGLFPDLSTAMRWFEIVEPLLYRFLMGAPEGAIKNKAAILAEGIIEASYAGEPDPDKAYTRFLNSGEIGRGRFKLLSSKLVFGPEHLVEIEGELFDEWLIAKEGLEGWGIPAVTVMPLSEDTLEPILSFQETALAAGEWRESVSSGEARRATLERKAMLKALRAGKEHERAVSRIEKRMQVLTSREIDEREPYLVCAVRTKRKLNRRKEQLKHNKHLVQVSIPRLPERARSLGMEPRARLRKVEVKEQWMESARVYGLLLELVKEPDGREAYTVPDGDLLFAEELFDKDLLERPSPMLGWFGTRNMLTKWGKSKRDKRSITGVVRTLERRRREAPGTDREKMRRMGEKFRPGTEPKTYIFGVRTGNLYPAKYIRYIGHLKKELPEYSKYQSVVGNETVLAELLYEDPYRPVLERSDEPELIYKVPDKRLVICFEDELMTISSGEERMIRADLHRYFEAE